MFTNIDLFDFPVTEPIAFDKAFVTTGTVFFNVSAPTLAIEDTTSGFCAANFAIDDATEAAIILINIL